MQNVEHIATTMPNESSAGGTVLQICLDMSSREFTADEQIEAGRSTARFLLAQADATVDDEAFSNLD